MVDLYYLLGLIFIYGEFKMFEEARRAAEVKVTLKDKKITIASLPRDEQKEAIKYLVFHLGYMVWMFFGLFSGQQMIFLIFFILGVILGNITNSLKTIDSKAKMIKVDSVVSIMALFFIILNHFKHFI
jgi:hypothetical protein